MKKKILIILGIALGLYLIYYFFIRKMRSTHVYSWMKDWSNKKIETYKDWVINQMIIHDEEIKTLKTGDEKRDRATTKYFEGEAGVILDSYWRNKWEEYWAKVMDAQRLNFNGFKL